MPLAFNGQSDLGNDVSVKATLPSSEFTFQCPQSATRTVSPSFLEKQSCSHPNVPTPNASPEKKRVRPTANEETPLLPIKFPQLVQAADDNDDDDMPALSNVGASDDESGSEYNSDSSEDDDSDDGDDDETPVDTATLPSETNDISHRVLAMGFHEDNNVDGEATGSRSAEGDIPSVPALVSAVVTAPKGTLTSFWKVESKEEHCLRQLREAEVATAWRDEVKVAATGRRCKRKRGHVNWLNCDSRSSAMR